MKSNLILIGMPGCGKSSVGAELARVLGYSFIDSDKLIQASENRSLSAIIEHEGSSKFNEIEEKVNVSINCENTVIATGGSAVYGHKAMQHFKEIGTVVYLKLPYEQIAERLDDLTQRGVSFREGQTLKDLYMERIKLYEMWADKILDVADLGIEEIIEKIIEVVPTFTRAQIQY